MNYSKKLYFIAQHLFSAKPPCSFIFWLWASTTIT